MHKGFVQKQKEVIFLANILIGGHECFVSMMHIFQVLLHKRKQTGLDLVPSSPALIQLFLVCSKYRQNHKQQKLVVREGINRTNENEGFGTTLRGGLN